MKLQTKDTLKTVDADGNTIEWRYGDETRDFWRTNDGPWMEELKSMCLCDMGEIKDA